MNPAMVQAAFTFAAFIFLLLPVERLALRARLLVLAALVAAGALPIDGAPLAAYVRGLVGDLAVTTMVLLVWGLLRGMLQWQRPPLSRRAEPAAFFALLGLALYPATLGLSAVDPYRLGFEPAALLAVCGAITVIFSLRGHSLPAMAMILATVAFSLDLGTSHNYWDYILDPLLVFYSLGVVLRWAITALRKRVAADKESGPSQLVPASEHAG